MKKLNPTGFGAIESLLILVIVVGLGFVGYFVWHANRTTSNQLSSSSSTNPAPKNVAPDYATDLSYFNKCLLTVDSKLISNGNVCKTSDGGTVPHPLVDPATKGQYITISQWGVRAFYNGSQSISYKVNQFDAAVFSSKQLTAISADCEGRGGMIARLAPTDPVDGGYGTAQNYFATADKNSYALVNGYYYQFEHDQGACGEDINTTYKTEAAQQLLNDTVKSLVPKLQAIPKS